MALFTIQRYEGEDENIDDDLESVISCSSDLPKKHKKRKHHSKEENGSINETPESEECSHKHKKKKKHNKHEEDEPILEQQDTTINESVELSDSKLSDNEDSDDEAGESTDIVNETTESIEGPHEHGDFTVLGSYQQKTIDKVKRVLPDWLCNPTIITGDLRTDAASIDSIPRLDPLLVKTLQANGVKSFFPVQAHVVPALLDLCGNGIRVGPGGYQPNDICVSSPTGSGKTLAFVLPIVQALKERVVPKVRAIAILPVQSLALQVYNVFKLYCEHTNLKVGLLVGQDTFEREQSSLLRTRLLGYESLADIIVATPGRLVDHINKTEGFDLTHMRFLVIDEADKTMADIKQDWLSVLENAVYHKSETISDSCSRNRLTALTVSQSQKNRMPFQKLLFSATLSHNPERLNQLKLFQPKLFVSITSDLLKNSEELLTAENEGGFIGKYTTPVGLTEFFVESSLDQKPLVILHFLHTLKMRQILCFTNSVETTKRLYLLLKDVGNIEVSRFSSELHSIKRNKLLRKFAAGKIDILICTDAMARGMDIENVKYVISYDLPKYFKTYIHRVGRTARAGKPGSAYMILEHKQIFHFKTMIKDAGKSRLKEMKCNKKTLEPFIGAYEQALKNLPRAIKVEPYKKPVVSAKRLHKTS